MLTFSMLGALLIIAGIVYLAAAAIGRGRMSDPHDTPADTTHTLEPRHRGMAFLGGRATWPGHALVAIGILLLLLPLAF